MIKCPNKNLPEWKELERLCPDTCYIVWDAFPYGIDKAPNGAPSRLFSDLLKHYDGDRDAAIKAKAKTVTNAFKTWFGDWLNVNTFNIDAIDTTKVDIVLDKKPWKNDPSRVNDVIRFYIKDKSEKGYFELVKDEEFGYFSVHFKTSTEKTGSLTTSKGETSVPSTYEERKILWEQLLIAIPNGAKVSTWGELSEDGIRAIDKLGRIGKFTKVGERRVSKKTTGEKIMIPIWEKGNVSKVVDENGEPLIVYHGTRTSNNIIEQGFSKNMSGKGNRGADMGYFYFTNSYENAKYTGVKESEIEPLIDIITSVYDLFDSVDLPTFDDLYKFVDLKYKEQKEYLNKLQRLKEDSFIKKLLSKIIKLFNSNYKTSKELREQYLQSIKDIDKIINELNDKIKVLYNYKLGLSYLSGDRSKASINTLHFIKETISKNSQYRQIAANKLINVLYNTEDLVYSPDILPVFLSIRNPQNSDYQMKPSDVNPLTIGKFTPEFINYNEKESKLLEELRDPKYDGAISRNKFDILFGDIYIAKHSNQIKSIDNEGNFSLTDDNIKHRILSYIKAAKQEDDKPNVNKSLYDNMSSIDNSSDAIQWLIDNNAIPDRLIGLAKMLQKHSIPFSVDSKDDGETVGGYTPSSKSMRLYPRAFAHGKQYLAETVLHEMLHHYLGDAYANKQGYREFVDNLVQKYRSLSTKSEVNRWYGLREGGEEFINEIMTNTDFVEFLKKKENNLWNKFKRFVARMLTKLVGKESHISESVSLDDVIEALTTVVERISDTKPLSDKSSSFIKFKKDDKIVSSLEYEAKVMRRKIQQGIESRIKAFNQYGKITANMVMRMEQELAKLQELWQKNEDKLAMIKFLEHAANESKAPVKAIDKAFEEFSETGKFSLRNEQLVQMYRDFIGFYEPIIEDINEKLFVTGYFDDFTEEQYEYFGNLLTNATKDFNSIRGKYNRLLAARFGEILKKHATEGQKESIEEYVRDNTNYTSDDINWYMTYVGGMKNTGDQALSIVAKMVNDIQNEIERQTINKAEEITKAFSSIKTSDWQKFYEKDSKGKKTGYLVRKRNYGQYYRDYYAFMEELGEPPIDDREKLKEWRIKRNKWLSEHAERRYKPEYYDLFLNLSFAAQEARDSIQTEIGGILDKYLKSDGTIRIEDIPDDEWNRLQSLYQEKRRLANRYNNDGTKKSGIDLEIAEELKEINDKLQKNLSYKKNTKKFEETVAQKRATLSKEKFDLWYRRSTVVTYSDEFQALLSNIDKKYYTKEYEELSEEKRELTSLYRNTHDFMINTRIMPDAVKERIKDIDLRMAQIRDEIHNNEKSDFSKIAYMEKSAYYKAEKAAAIERDKNNPGEYQKWFNENHYIDSRGQAVPYSYFMMMMPKDKKNVVIAPSREFSEVDPSSPYWNENFDITDSEYIQPSKKLYDNTKAYEEATSTPEMQAVYDTIVSTMNESNDKITFLKRKNNYKLPQQSGGAYAFMQGTGSVAKGLWRYTKDRFTIKGDDTEFNYESLAPDGSKLDTIATHYINMLDDPSTISNNLAGILINYYQMATNYELKSKMLPELKIIQNQIENREYQPGLSEDDGIVGEANRIARRIGDKIGSYIRPSGAGRTRAAIRLERYMDNNIFGSQYGAIKIGKYNIVKALIGIRNYATLVNLGASIFIAGANVLGGALQHITESLTGVYYTPKTSLVALRNCIYNFCKIALSGGNYRHENKLLALMNKNQISRDSSRMFKRLNYNRFARFLLNHLWFGMMSAGDFVIKGNILTSVYLNTKFVPSEGRFMMRDEYLQQHYGEKGAGKAFDKLNTITLYDMYKAKGISTELNSKYSEYHQYVTKELEDRVANVLHYLSERADGSVSASDRNIAQANALIGFTVMHKGFLLNALEDRVFKPAAYNYTIDRMDEAFYKTGIRRVYEILKYGYEFLRYGRNSAELRKLNFYESYNMKRIVAELSLIIVYNLISSLLNSGDDDDDDWGKSATKYTMARGAYEALNLYNPIDVYRSFKTLTPASTSLENLGTALFPIKMLFSDEDEGLRKKVKYGPYKGMTGWERAVWKSTPLKNIIEATDPKQKHKYLKSQLQ